MADALADIEALARELFRAADPGNVWAAVDECVRLHWRRQAQQRLTAKMHCFADVEERTEPVRQRSFR